MRKYFFSILALIAACIQLSAQVEELPKDSIQKKEILNHLRIDLDVSPIITSLISGGESFSFETALQAEIFNRYFPVFELGFAGANKLSSSGIQYKGNGLFYRAGLDFNLLKNKAENPKYLNYFLFGARLGYSYFDYNVLNLSFVDDYWNINISDNRHLSASKLWFEIAAGVRVEMYKNLYMGWTVKIKNLLNNSKDGDFKAWYIPGYGFEGDGSVWGFNYIIGYKIFNNK